MQHCSKGQTTCLNVVCTRCLRSFYFIFPFFSQFPSPYPVVQIPAPFSPAPSNYSSSDTTISASYYSPSTHLPSLPLTPHTALTSIPSLGTPQTSMSSPQSVPGLALPFTHVGIAKSPVVSHQQGGVSTSQHLTNSFRSTQLLTFSQVQPTPFPVPHPEQELAGQPVQVNISLRSHCNGSVLRNL